MGTVRIFKHHFHAAFLWLAVVEGGLFIAAVFVGAYLRFEGDSSLALENIGPIWPRAVVFAGVMLLGMTAVGLYQPRLREGAAGIVLRMLGALLLVSLALSVIFYLFPDLFLGRGALALTFVAAILFSGGVRYLFRTLVNEERLKRNVLVLGAGQNAALVMSRLRRKTDRRGFSFTAFVQMANETVCVEHVPVVRLDGSICDYVRNHAVDEILIAVDDRRQALPIEELLECKLAGIEVSDVVNFFERESGKIMLEFVTPGWMVFSDGFKLGFWRNTSKRVFDVAASLLLLFYTWPFMLLTIIAIKLEDGRDAPVFYRQKRVGLNGKPFDVLKFRSMRVNAEQNGAVWAKTQDDRVTKVGRFIRKCRIDELPQIINVLAGDMGFVGPRPERPEFVKGLTQKIPHYQARHHVKPGISGWAQLWYPYGASEKDAELKLQYDLYYVKNHTLFLDILVLVRTVEVVLFGKGAR